MLTSVEVGPALFISLLIITLSFIPIFTLEGQEGKLFGPLDHHDRQQRRPGHRPGFGEGQRAEQFALLAFEGENGIMVIPILMGFWIRGRIPAESSNPLNRFLIRIYQCGSKSGSAGCCSPPGSCRGSRSPSGSGSP
jgi:Cu(I)/Ag(I) efflux system membrane protein CusA/SilA